MIRTICNYCSIACNLDTGFVEHDQRHCASCGMCIMACPFGTLKMDRITGERLMKCDMCGSFAGKSPFCVEKCPMQAITAAEAQR
ncbi:MAG: 4Fe-4S binding protein [Spirochaetaceae bacterium]|jgi:carbon-monoxide dehydrogenase iron sulfur subunit|nr:4Fe-4S binding protein [Spirochaetaceae bacterium]